MRKHLTSLLALVLVLLVAAPNVHAQTAIDPNIWRTFAERIDVGRTLRMRTTSGERFKATLLAVSNEGIMVQPKTRVPVPPQMVPYNTIASLEIDNGKGANVGKAIAIGAAVAAGAFFGLMAITFVLVGD